MKQLQKLSDEAVIATALTSARTLPVRHQRSYTSGPSFYLLLVLNLGPEWEWEPAEGADSYGRLLMINLSITITESRQLADPDLTGRALCSRPSCADSEAVSLSLQTTLNQKKIQTSFT